DFDRCFLFDHNGRFIEGYYIVGLLGVQLLQQNPGERIVHDPRLTWNTIELVEASNGEAVQSKSGHAFIKETMRAVNGIYGGEMSAHHYFREFGYCDSGMIPWLLLAQMISSQNRSLAQMVDERIERYPVSGEINSQVADPAAVIERVEANYADLPHQIDRTDGLGMDFGEWRFNLRASNTEPLLRMNVESRGDYALMEKRRDEILDLMK
ncbi:MAG: phosphomannomutase, partial [Gammaproteobacteria bacterium]|nr:phosphomannomutase [Gammaproteobacteria bacterium]